MVISLPSFLVPMAKTCIVKWRENKSKVVNETTKLRKARKRSLSLCK